MPRYKLDTTVVVLLLLWLLGAFASPVGGNRIHPLPVVAAVVAAVRLVQGRGATP